jgi:hypothetical protein
MTMTILCTHSNRSWRFHNGKHLTKNREMNGVSKVALLMLLFVVNGNAIAEEWVAVNHNEYATGYVNPATIVKEGNIVKMWSLVDCKAVSYFIGGSPFISIKSYEEFDCMEKKLRTLAYSMYSGKMGEGEVVFSDSNPGQWEQVQSDSQMNDILNVACGKM